MGNQHHFSYFAKKNVQRTVQKSKLKINQKYFLHPCHDDGGCLLILSSVLILHLIAFSLSRSLMMTAKDVRQPLNHLTRAFVMYCPFPRWINRNRFVSNSLTSMIERSLESFPQLKSLSFINKTRTNFLSKWF